GAMLVQQLTGECALGACFPEYGVLLWAQLGSPLVLSLLHGVRHVLSRLLRLVGWVRLPSLSKRRSRAKRSRRGTVRTWLPRSSRCRSATASSRSRIPTASTFRHAPRRSSTSPTTTCRWRTGSSVPCTT